MYNEAVTQRRQTKLWLAIRFAMAFVALHACAFGPTVLCTAATTTAAKADSCCSDPQQKKKCQDCCVENHSDEATAPQKASTIDTSVCLMSSLGISVVVESISAQKCIFELLINAPSHAPPRMDAPRAPPASIA